MTTTSLQQHLSCRLNYPGDPHQKGKARKVKPIWNYWSKR